VSPFVDGSWDKKSFDDLKASLGNVSALSDALLKKLKKPGSEISLSPESVCRQLDSIQNALDIAAIAAGWCADDDFEGVVHYQGDESPK
jgi:hypothetical protein